MTPNDHTSTFDDIYAPSMKVYGGRYQYVPTPCDVRSIFVS